MELSSKKPHKDEEDHEIEHDEGDEEGGEEPMELVQNDQDLRTVKEELYC